MRPQYDITDTGAAYLAFCQKHSVPSDNVQSQTVLKLLYISKAYICLGYIYMVHTVGYLLSGETSKLFQSALYRKEKKSLRFSAIITGAS